MFDLLIKNGRIIDGAGNPWYRGDLGVIEGRIAEISKKPLENAAASLTIDAHDRIIAPGFIDMHAHADLGIIREPECLGRLRQGVTTLVVGNCGLSAAPVTPGAQALLKGPYEPTLGSWQDWRWSDLSQYFDYIGKFRLGVNLALLIGHATVRTAVMEGIQNRGMTPAEYNRMEKTLALAMEEGAFGISTGLIYPPSCYADTAELIAIAKIIAKYGGFYASHIRGEGTTLINAINEVIGIAGDAKIAAHISHLKANNPRVWGKVNDALELIEKARADGMDISCDQYPYTAGSGSLSALTPPWVQEGGVLTMIERLKDPAVRSRIVQEFESEDTPGWDNYVKPTGWDKIVITWVKSEKNKDLEGLSVAVISAEKGKEPWDTVADLLIEEMGAVQMIGYIMSETDVQTVLRYRGTMIGSDGIESGGKPHPRLYGSFPRILERYVRQLKLLTLEDAVRKMSALPAARLGLTDRGILKKGLRADMIIFDPEKVAERTSYDNPYQTPVGIEYVIVNGGVSVSEGQATNEFYGEILRKRG